MKLTIILVLLGGVMMIGWGFHRRCNAHLQEMVTQVARLRQDNCKLLNHNCQLMKQIEVREIWQKNHIANLISTLSRLSVGHDKQQGKQAHLAIRCSLGRLSRSTVADLPRAAPPNISYRLIDIMTSVRACWQDELQHAGIKVERDIRISDEMIELRQWGADIIFNAIFSHTLQRLTPGQILSIECQSVAGKAVIRFSDHGLSCAYLAQAILFDREGHLLSLPTLTRDTGGELIICSGEQGNLVELSWSLACQGAGEILDDCGGAATTALTAQGDWLSKLEQLVCVHFSEPDFSTARAARLLLLSERSLQRRLKQLTNRTFTEYLTHYRLEQACLQLRSGARVSHVAFECGFNDPSYFSQRFKQYYGLSPSQYIANGYRL